MSAIRDNTLRGELLKFLRHIYPDNTSEDNLTAIFYPYHRDKDIVASIEYLADKGYVTRRQVPHPYSKGKFITLYKITPSGIDLVDGVSTDSAVAVPPPEES